MQGSTTPLYLRRARGGITLICDVLVGPCFREQTDHLEVSTLRCDEQGGGTAVPSCIAMSLSVVFFLLFLVSRLLFLLFLLFSVF